MFPEFAVYSFLVFLVVLLSIEIYDHVARHRRLMRAFPGPKPVPFLGNLKELMVGSVGVFKALRRFAKEYYPIYKMASCTPFPSINIIGPEDMQSILSSVKHNEKSNLYLVLKPWLGEGLLTSGGDKWIQRRKILTPTFHFKILKKFIRIFNKHADEFGENLTEGTVDILPEVHKCSLHMIAEAAMGVELKDKESEKKYRESIHQMGENIVYRILHPWLYFRVCNLFTRFYYVELKVLKYLKDFTKKVIDEREKNFNESDVHDMTEDVCDFGSVKKRLAMLDLLIQAKRQNQITAEGICEEVDTFMFEGHDTISMATSFCYMLLACNREVQDRVYDEITSATDGTEEITIEALQSLTYTEQAIKESLRLYPSVPLISRICGEDVKVHDSDLIIPRGASIILHIFDTHRIPEIYPEPEKFDPDRFSAENSKGRHPYAYLPFSAGSRNCIGQRYAMLSMKCMLVWLLRRYELLPVDTPETIELVADIVLRSNGPIRIKLKPRAKVL